MVKFNSHMLPTYVFFFLMLLMGVVVASDVDIALKASWKTTPLLAETSEYLTTQGDGYFWRFIDFVHNKVKSESIDIDHVSDQTLYQLAFTGVQHVLGDSFSSEEKQLFKYALSTRHFSPKVEMIRNVVVDDFLLSPEHKPENEDGFVVVQGQKFYSVSSLREHFESISEKNHDKTLIYDFDHVHSKSSDDSPTAILCGRIGSKAFSDLYHELTSGETSSKLSQLVVRHFDPLVFQESSDQLSVQGYNIELQIKKMEYNAMDISADDGNNADTEIDDEKNDSESDDAEFDAPKSQHRSVPDNITLLNEDQLKDLNIKAAAQILNANAPLSAMEDLISHIPKTGGALSTNLVSKSLREAVEQNRQGSVLSRFSNMILLNGRKLDLSKLNIFNLFNLIRDESNYFHRMKSLGIDQSQIHNLTSSISFTSLNQAPIDKLPRFDIFNNDEDQPGLNNAIVYFNDIEKDEMYNKLSKSVKSILHRSIYGINFARKNIHNLVYVFDPSDFESLNAVAPVLSMLQQGPPFRVGILMFDPEHAQTTSTALASSSGRQSVEIDASGHVGPASHGEDKGDAQAPVQDTLAAKIIQAFHALKGKKQGRHLKKIQFLTELVAEAKQNNRQQIEESDVAKAFSTVTKKLKLSEIVKDEELQAHVQKASLLMNAKNIPVDSSSSPMLFYNGALFSSELLISMGERHLQQLIPMEHQRLQMLVHQESIDDDSQDLPLDVIRSSPNVFKKYSAAVFSTENNQAYPMSLDQVQNLPSIASVWTHAKSTDIIPVTNIVVFNPEHMDGLRIVKNAIGYYLSSLRNSEDTKRRSRFIFIQNHDNNNNDHSFSQIMDLLLSHNNDQDPISAARAAQKFLEKMTSESGLAFGQTARETIDHILSRIPELQQIQKDFQRISNDALESHKQKIRDQNKFVRNVFDKLQDKNAAVVVNGQSYETVLNENDFEVLQSVEYDMRASQAESALDIVKFDNSRINVDSIDSAWKSSFIAALESCIASDMQQQGSRMSFSADTLPNADAVVHVDGNTPLLSVTAVFNPLSVEAQKFIPMVKMLNEFYGAQVTLVMNPSETVDSLALKRYVSMNIEPELQFDNDGRMRPHTTGITGLPRDVTLTLAVETPESWLATPVYAEADLDNIRLSSSSGDHVYGEYELENIVVTGSCIDKTSSSPPRGLQLILGTQHDPHQVDTLVMANYGYFQLKASPRVWRLRLAEGTASEIYEIKSSLGINYYNNRLGEEQDLSDVGSDGSNVESRESARLMVGSFDGDMVYLMVQKRPGKESVEYLDALAERMPSKQKPGTFSQLWSRMSGSSHGEDKEQRETVNVFSVASGHLYERLLKIMMLSVIKHTGKTSPIKFWFVKNFLSPQFKAFIPKMAAEYGFDYQLVTYKWPSWLHKQTEKQRMIWAYKVLFLDVLFPLNVNKIIFVDADQVTRSDLTELWDMDLQGKPLGYTPFCDSRTEMEGYRFWKSGFWKNHLRGKPYHISALYVVDIQKLRQMAAGDSFRAVYDQLSRDPNSLSNLDQDLPNYTQHQIPIHSLPQEWLWCETWCDDESKKHAKTIDLCNNPMTKEHKVESAKRIIPEWTEYDNEITELTKRLSEK
eukprot:gb/GECH01014990.1/.p1 GENE.gb/GECH01014990.1/~~gb/GECH01014990.1/.p1  ORF type:complete len:1598 (+),score=405.33 gb/GECH01014990.1/:1-4794(+)